jgi:hypothetical protein
MPDYAALRAISAAFVPPRANEFDITALSFTPVRAAPASITVNGHPGGRVAQTAEQAVYTRVSCCRPIPRSYCEKTGLSKGGRCLLQGHGEERCCIAGVAAPDGMKNMSF